MPLRRTRKNEELKYDKGVAHTDEEGNVNSIGSLKGVIEIPLQVEKSLITRVLLRSEKIITNERDVLKHAVESLPMPLQVVCYEFIS